MMNYIITSLKIALTLIIWVLCLWFWAMLLLAYVPTQLLIPSTLISACIFLGFLFGRDWDFLK